MKTIAMLMFIILVVLPAPLRAGIEENVGFGFFEPAQDFPCLTEAQREEIRTRLDANIEQLESMGVLPPADRSRDVSFTWPLQAGPGMHDYGYHGVSGLVDHNPLNPGYLLDYNCGDRTYDVAGYNHQGSDYFLWPFCWYKMDYDQVEIIAAAPGHIINKDNGNYDRNCEMNSDPWNAVYILHDDGSEAWYGHMKNGSLTSLPIGAYVEAGEYLGIVGSSGSSTAPHLHFEVYDEYGALIDPYAGPCNSMNENSWWIEQPPYYDSAVNAVMTHDADPEFPPCPQQEVIHACDTFEPGQVIYMAAYYRDQRANQESEYTLRRPDGTVQWNWTHSFSSPTYYQASYWYWYNTLPWNAPTGTWTWEVLYEGETYVHHLYVGPASSADDAVTLEVPELTAASSNPFVSGVNLVYRLPDAGRTQLAVYDCHGRRIADLVDGFEPAGSRTIAWPGKDGRGRAVPAGVYFARLQSGSSSRVLKLVLSH